MNQHIPVPYKRDAAQITRSRTGRLDMLRACASLETVVAARDDWAGTEVLNRYPSPSGRTGRHLGRPPFFRGWQITERAVNRQGFAQSAACVADGLEWCRVLAKLPMPTAVNTESRTSCDQETGSLPLPPAAPWRPAAILSKNKRSSGRVRGPRAPRSPMAIFSPARLSAQPQMSPIAGNTRRAATERATPAFAPLEIGNPVVASRRDGFFVAVAPGPVPGGQEPEGTRHVQ